MICDPYGNDASHIYVTIGRWTNANPAFRYAFFLIAILQFNGVHAYRSDDAPELPNGWLRVRSELLSTLMLGLLFGERSPYN